MIKSFYFLAATGTNDYSENRKSTVVVNFDATSRPGNPLIHRGPANTNLPSPYIPGLEDDESIRTSPVKALDPSSAGPNPSGPPQSPPGG